MNSKQVFLMELALSLLLIFGTGCSPTVNDIEAFVKPYEKSVTATEYILMPPDRIEVHSTNVPEIDRVFQQIRPDGKVSFQTIGEVEAAGKTPAELTALITEKVSALYKLPSGHPIDVRITAYHSKVYYMVGELVNPGPKEYTGRISSIKAIGLAGLRPTAWKEKFTIIRPSHHPDVVPLSFILDWKNVEKGDLTRDILLEEGDIIYIPPTPLAALGNLFAEFAYPIGQALSPVTAIQNVSEPRSGYR
jgi:polysaccharide export outer membrane protein